MGGEAGVIVTRWSGDDKGGDRLQFAGGTTAVYETATSEDDDKGRIEERPGLRRDAEGRCGGHSMPCVASRYDGPGRVIYRVFAPMSLRVRIYGGAV